MAYTARTEPLDIPSWCDAFPSITGYATAAHEGEAPTGDMLLTSQLRGIDDNLERRETVKVKTAEHDLLLWYGRGIQPQPTEIVVRAEGAQSSRLMADLAAVSADLAIGTQRDAKGKGKRRAKYGHPTPPWPLPSPTAPLDDGTQTRSDGTRAWEPVDGGPVTFDQDFLTTTPLRTCASSATWNGRQATQWLG